MSDSSIAIICTSFVSVISVCVPLLATLISNKHSKEMKELELKYENKVNAYKEFFCEYGKFISVSSYLNLQSLGEAVSKALMFANEQIRAKLLIILQYCAKAETISEINRSYIETAYIEVVPLIAEDLANTYNVFNGKKHTKQKLKDSKSNTSIQTHTK